MVRLAEPSLATYPGGIPGLAATSPRVTGALDVTSDASVAYLEHLADRQAAVRSTLERERAPAAVLPLGDVLIATELGGLRRHLAGARAELGDDQQ